MSNLFGDIKGCSWYKSLLYRLFGKRHVFDGKDGKVIYYIFNDKIYFHKVIIDE